MRWFIAAIAIVGCGFNIAHSRISFLLWTVSNLYWCQYNWRRREHAQAVVFFVMLLMCVYAFWSWSR